MITHNAFINTQSRRVLLIESEPELANLLILNLTAMGHQITLCHTLSDARKRLLQQDIDLLLMNRTLPDGDSTILCQQLRQAGNQTPCMMIAANGSETDIVLGLESGADDYLTNPFHVLELRARVKALLRRGLPAPSPSHTEELSFYGLTININTREVITEHGNNQTSLDLTAREFDLLLYLAQHPKQVFSRMQLLEAVWGYSHNGYEHTVNSHINRLRTKLARCAGTSKLVKTVWGVGYKFSPPEKLVA